MERESHLVWSYDPHSLRSRRLPKAELRVNQLSIINHPSAVAWAKAGQLSDYSVTSSSCIPSTSTFPETRSRPERNACHAEASGRAVALAKEDGEGWWSRYRFSPRALL